MYRRLHKLNCSPCNLNNQNLLHKVPLIHFVSFSLSVGQYLSLLCRPCSSSHQSLSLSHPTQAENEALQSRHPHFHRIRWFLPMYVFLLKLRWLCPLHKSRSQARSRWPYHTLYRRCGLLGTLDTRLALNKAGPFHRYPSFPFRRGSEPQVRKYLLPATSCWLCRIERTSRSLACSQDSRWLSKRPQSHLDSSSLSKLRWLCPLHKSRSQARSRYFCHIVSKTLNSTYSQDNQ
jgi:hypothetical protein